MWGTLASEGASLHSPQGPGALCLSLTALPQLPEKQEAGWMSSVWRDECKMTLSPFIHFLSEDSDSQMGWTLLYTSCPRTVTLTRQLFPPCSTSS